MPRKGPAVRREIEPDPVYQNPLVTQLINKILLNGKKSTAERIVYKALEQISERTANDPVITLKKAVENARPLLEVKSRRVDRGPPDQGNDARAAVARELHASAPRAHHERAACGGDHGRGQRAGFVGQASRGPPQDGRGEPRVRPLPMVSIEGSFEAGLRGGPALVRGIV